VLAEARKRLAHRYPTYAEFEALDPRGKPGEDGRLYEPRELELLEPDENGNTDVAPLNAAFATAYLADPRNPRWVAKPTVAYLWARTVRCKGCRATIPLLKTRWLAKKDNKRVLLTVTPNAERTGVVFGVENDVAVVGGNAGQRREHDKHRGAGTMTCAGAQCPCCPTIMTMEDIRLEGRAGRLSGVMTAVSVDGPNGKEYRLPTKEELCAAEVSKEEIDGLYAEIQFGLPTERIPLGSSRAGGGSPFTTPLYGFDQWAKLCTPRQLATQSALIEAIKEAKGVVSAQHDPNVADTIVGFLACIMDRQADYVSTGCIWVNVHEKIGHQFSRFALPILWDIAEVCPFTTASGGLESAYEWVTKVVDHLQAATLTAPRPKVEARSAMGGHDGPLRRDNYRSPIL
jgi:adenine-specific DNA methylase